MRKKERYFWARKKSGVGPYPDTWHLPGGGVNLGEESIDEAIRREVKEETFLEITNLERVAFDEDFEPDKHGEETHYIFLVYKMNAATFEFKAMDDLVELRWFDKSELKNIPLPRPLTKQLKLGLL